MALIVYLLHAFNNVINILSKSKMTPESNFRQQIQHLWV